jgi:serine/threonine protein kinase
VFPSILVFQDFYAEQCTLASLSHPNVVAFYGVVEESDGGCPGTVQEYLPGGSLRKALSRIKVRWAKGGGDGDAPRVKLALDVARGVEYLHWRRVIHFDIKADNILTDVRDPKCVRLAPSPLVQRADRERVTW